MIMRCVDSAIRLAGRSLALTLLGAAVLLAAPGSKASAYLDARDGLALVHVAVDADAESELESSIRELGGRVEYRPRNHQVFTVAIPHHAMESLRRWPFVKAASRLQQFVAPARRSPQYVDAELPSPDVSPAPGTDTCKQQGADAFVGYQHASTRVTELLDHDENGRQDIGSPVRNAAKVCLIDSGVEVTHSDLCSMGSRISGVSLIENERWDHDPYGHGTHVAGIIAASFDGGVRGLAPDVAGLHVVRFFNAEGKATVDSDLARALDECAMSGARVVNMSLMHNTPIAAERSAVDFALEQLYRDLGMLFVAAAGNSMASPMEQNFPAASPYVISVGAVDDRRLVADFSAHPDFAEGEAEVDDRWASHRGVELVAPGVNILSTVPHALPRNVERSVITIHGRQMRAWHFSGTSTAPASAELIDGAGCTLADAAAAWAGRIVICRNNPQVAATSSSRSYWPELSLADSFGAFGVIVVRENAALIPPDCHLRVGRRLVSRCGFDFPAMMVGEAEAQFMLSQVLRGKVSADLFPGDGACQRCVGSYEAWNGTSMAAPAVTAVAATLMGSCTGANPEFNVAVRQALRSGARRVAGRHPVSGTAYGISWPNTVAGWGEVDALGGLNALSRMLGLPCATGMVANPSTLHLCPARAESTSLQIVHVWENTAPSRITFSAAGMRLDPATVVGAGAPDSVIGNAPLRVLVDEHATALTVGMHTAFVSRTDLTESDLVARAAIRIHVHEPSLLAAVASVQNWLIDRKRLVVWQPVAGAVRYRVQFSATNDFSVVMAEYTVESRELSVPESMVSGATHVRVVAEGGCGESALGAPQVLL